MQKATFEFHFQELFSGEKIELMVDGEVRAQFVAQTRFQTGLAHIETLVLSDGEEVVLLIEESDVTAAVKVDVTKPYVVVRMMDGALSVDATQTSPGYL